jgi:hypothetical protein
VISARVGAGVLLTVAGVLLVVLVNVAAGVVALVVGVGLLLPLQGGGEGDETSFEGTDLSGGGGGDGGGGL